MKKSTLEIPLGEDRTIQVNSPVEFVIRMESGTEIKGTISQNNPLKITNHGGISSVDINVNEAPNGEFKVLD